MPPQQRWMIRRRLPGIPQRSRRHRRQPLKARPAPAARRQLPARLPQCAKPPAHDFYGWADFTPACDLHVRARAAAAAAYPFSSSSSVITEPLVATLACLMPPHSQHRGRHATALTYGQDGGMLTFASVRCRPAVSPRAMTTFDPRLCMLRQSCMVIMSPSTITTVNIYSGASREDRLNW